MEKKRVTTRPAERCTRAEKKKHARERPSGATTAVHSLVILFSRGCVLPDIR